MLQVKAGGVWGWGVPGRIRPGSLQRPGEGVQPPRKVQISLGRGGGFVRENTRDEGLEGQGRRLHAKAQGSRKLRAGSVHGF